MTSSPSPKIVWTSVPGISWTAFSFCEANSNTIELTTSAATNVDLSFSENKTKQNNSNNKTQQLVVSLLSQFMGDAVTSSGLGQKVRVQALAGFNLLRFRAKHFTLIHASLSAQQGPVFWRTISANPRLKNSNTSFFIPLFKSLFGVMNSNLSRASIIKLSTKKFLPSFLLKLSALKSDFTQTLGYLNPASNNQTQE